MSTVSNTARNTVIIDSGGANLASLQFALERLNAPATVTTSPREVQSAERVILPGVGSAADAMERLHASGLAEVMPTLKQPVLGICLGMQLLFKHSEEGAGRLPGHHPRHGQEAEGGTRPPRAAHGLEHAHQPPR